jgi:uncharacterized Zn finger protein
MNIDCNNCGKSFSPNKKSAKLIKEASEKGMKLLMLSCELCGDSIPINLRALDALDQSNLSEQYRCPVKTCNGFVLHIEDQINNFYGCGECGTVWDEKKALFTDITKIVSKYSYRKAVYKFDGDNIFPVKLELEPTNYDAKVLKEWDS